MGDGIWQWVTQILLGIIIAGIGFYIKSVNSDVRSQSRDMTSLWKELKAMDRTLYQEFAMKSDVLKLENKIENLVIKIDSMPDRIMDKIEKVLDRLK